MRQKLLEIVFETSCNLRNGVGNRCNLRIRVLEISCNQCFNNHLAHFNGVLLAHLWLVFDGSKNAANRFNAACAEFLFLLSLPLNGGQDVFEAWHKFIVV